MADQTNDIYALWPAQRDCFRVDADATVTAYCVHCLCTDTHGDVSLNAPCRLCGYTSDTDDVDLRRSMGFSRHQICNACFRHHTDFMLEWGHSIPAVASMEDQLSVLSDVARQALDYSRKKLGVPT